MLILLKPHARRQQIPDDQNGELIDPEDDEVNDDEEIIGPDGERG
jgi:hypothetical protein